MHIEMDVRPYNVKEDVLGVKTQTECSANKEPEAAHPIGLWCVEKAARTAFHRQAGSIGRQKRRRRTNAGQEFYESKKQEAHNVDRQHRSLVEELPKNHSIFRTQDGIWRENVVRHQAQNNEQGCRCDQRRM